MEFSRIVCVSLFSYQGSLSLRQLIYFTTSSRSCQELFSFFSGYFLLLPQLPGSRNGSAVSVLLTACLLYHTFHLMSTTFFNFYNCLNCMFIRCFFDSLVRIPLFHQTVNCFFIFKSFKFQILLSSLLILSPLHLLEIFFLLLIQLPDRTAQAAY